MATKPPGGSKAGFVAIICILIIALIIAVTYVFYYVRMTQSCVVEPDIMCWNDWKCPYAVQCTIPGQQDCWAGTEAVYAGTNADQCRFQPGGGLPENCTCGWDDTASAVVCNPL